MNVNREIIKALNHKQWVSIEYDGNDGITKYWIGIKNYHYFKNQTNEVRLILDCKLFNVIKENIIDNARVYYDKILTAKAVYGTFFAESLNVEENEDEFLESISLSKEKYNDKILAYFSECSKLDTTPYVSLYTQVLGISTETLLKDDRFQLTDTQYKNIIKKFGSKNDSKQIDTLALNELSINTQFGLYVLAYRNLVLDIETKCLIPEKHITINKNFILKNGQTEKELSILMFLDEEDYFLIDSIEITKEELANAVGKNVKKEQVDDSPHIVSLGRDIIVNLEKEYSSIQEDQDNGTLSIPLKSFFGLINKPIKRTASYPICLISPANLDQLLVINNALKYPITFVQGPPGTGKTKTIANVLVNALFNDMTVLVSTNNNVPLDGIYKTLSDLKYKEKYNILFPILRLGNDENIMNTLNGLTEVIDRSNKIQVMHERLESVKERYRSKKDKLRVIIENYAVKVDMEERKQLLEDEKIKDAFSLRAFDVIDSQLEKIDKKLKELEYINEDNEIIKESNEIDSDILMYLYFESARRIQKLNEPKFLEFLNILGAPDDETKVDMFKKYIKNDNNLNNLLKVFPIMFTTNISSTKIGSAKPHFDLLVMDEAGQCNSATALLPITRAERLLLVGDTSQLKPVILLDDTSNTILKEKFNIDSTYDYKNNSILKMFYTNDVVSNLILLKTHYRCDEKIINFNNKKFYNKMLIIKSKKKNKEPLVFVDVDGTTNNKKNTSIEEAEYIVDYCTKNPTLNIGVITPFKNQKNLIKNLLGDKNISSNVSCGTIHEFQGDEKDTIIFSTAITQKTAPGTYKWIETNKELINVATSRAKEKLVILGHEKSIKNLHKDEEDILYDLYLYTKENGKRDVSFCQSVGNRALNVKPFSTELEKAFLDNLEQVIECNYSSEMYQRKEVAAASIFNPVLNEKDMAYFYNCRFDFVLFNKHNDEPLLAIELCGNEHYTDKKVIKRDEKKKQICDNHNFKLVTIKNDYARRYGYLKQTLLDALFKEKK